MYTGQDKSGYTRKSSNEDKNKYRDRKPANIETKAESVRGRTTSSLGISG